MPGRLRTDPTRPPWRGHRACACYRRGVQAIVIEEPLWSNVAPARRHEWGLATQELLEDHSFSQISPVGLRIAVEGEVVQTRWEQAEGGVIEVAVARALLAPHLDEYTAICRRMGAAEHGLASSALEALDMAKRVAHDSAARTVQRLFKPVGPDHPTARRLFTLLLTLWVDTTRLTMLHAHRPFRPGKGSG